MADIKLFQGAGGGEPDQPTNTPDSLFSEDIVEVALAISEGPIRGLTQGAKSFYVGDTPLRSQSGTLNFEKFAVGVHPGYPDGMAKPLELVLGGESSNSVVGVALFSGVEVTRQTDSILRNKIDRLEVRINFSRLMRQDTSGTYRHTAQFMIQYKPASGFTWSNFYPESTISLEGKTTSGVVKEFVVSVPRINDDYQIRVVKVSPDSDTEHFVDMVWDSFQMVTKGPKVYPDTAILHLVGVSTGQFSSLPEFTGIYDGLLVRVPTNYNPDSRTYDDSVPWNGAFKFAWTNNPAWILYDLIVNQRYGLAAYRIHVDANRFDFYLAARWCDEPVLINDGPDTRPRYTFNDVIVEPRPAMEMLNYVAGSFNALVWDDLQGQIHLKVDKDEPAVEIFTPENVTEEGFEYTFTDLTTRANDISVAFINPDLDWNEDRRRIPNVTTNEEAIAKYGRVPLDFIAVGCTNAHEAVTKAQVRLISSLTETTMVNFVTTRQGVMLSLLDVILVADPLMGWSQTGRLTTYDENFLNFRDPIYIEEMKSYKLKLQTVNAIVEVDVQPEQIGHVTRLKLLSPLPPDIPRYTVFALEDTSGFGFAKPFRITAIDEIDGSPYQFRISGIELNRNKYVQAETNTNLEEFQYSYKDPALPGAPSNFKAETGDSQVFYDAVTGHTICRIYCSWTRPFGVVIKEYELQYQRVDVDYDWQSITGLTKEGAYISPADPGQAYNLRVRAINPGGNKSPWITLQNFFAEGPKVVPETVATFTATGDLFQNILKWTYPDAANILKVEVWGSVTDDLANAIKLTDLSYPSTAWTHIGLSMGMTFYYWIRVQNTSRIFSEFTTPSRAATTLTQPGRILDILQGQISTDQLVGDLNSRIDLVDADSTVPGSVAYRVASSQAYINDLLNGEIDNRIQDVQLVRNDVTTLQGIVNDPASGLVAVQAQIDDINTITVGSASASASALAALKTQVNDPATGLAAAQASITALNDVSSTSTSASAQYLFNLNTTVGNHSASIQQLSDSVDGISAEYFVKTDVNGNIAGFGIHNDGATSSFIILADKFAIATPGAETKYPFVVSVIGGQSVIGIDGNLVVAGSLSAISANLGVVTAGKMQSTDGKFVIDLDNKTISITV